MSGLDVVVLEAVLSGSPPPGPASAEAARRPARAVGWATWVGLCGWVAAFPRQCWRRTSAWWNTARTMARSSQRSWPSWSSLSPLPILCYLTDPTRKVGPAIGVEHGDRRVARLLGWLPVDTARTQRGPPQRHVPPVCRPMQPGPVDKRRPKRLGLLGFDRSGWSEGAGYAEWKAEHFGDLGR